MAGHSKWANIKHRKGKADAIKGKIFSRLTKEIISSVKVSGPDPKSNPRLRLAMQKAREANMPSDNVERNIKKASTQNCVDYTPVLYELYGYGGVGIIAEALTDNKNRIASEMRIATNKRGGTIATPGSVAFNFDQKGVIRIQGGTEETLFAAASEAGAEDFEAADEGWIVVAEPTALYAVKEGLEKAGLTVTAAELERIPKVLVECSEEDRKANLALIEWIEGIEDVDTVWHNLQL